MIDVIGDIEMSSVPLKDGEEFTGVDKLRSEDLAIRINVEINVVAQFDGFSDATSAYSEIQRINARIVLDSHVFFLILWRSSPSTIVCRASYPRRRAVVGADRLREDG